jgi:hypothetical protein
MNSSLVPLTTAQDQVPALIIVAGERASMRFLEFFAANIRNPHTRRAYARAADEFLAWCASVGVPAIGAVHLVHVATWIEAGTRELSVGQEIGLTCGWLRTGEPAPGWRLDRRGQRPSDRPPSREDGRNSPYELLYRACRG